MKLTKEEKQDNLIIAGFVVFQGLLAGLHFSPWGICPLIPLIAYFALSFVLLGKCLFEMIRFMCIKDERPSWTSR